MKTLLTLLLLTTFALPTRASEIRVRNDSNLDFKDVVVGGKTYGDIKQGATSGYQTWKVAYHYSSVSLVAGSKPQSILPEDYVGEKPLGDGHFTFVLTIKDGNLDIRAEKDNELLKLQLVSAKLTLKALEVADLRGICFNVSGMISFSVPSTGETFKWSPKSGDTHENTTAAAAVLAELRRADRVILWVLPPPEDSKDYTIEVMSLVYNSLK